MECYRSDQEVVDIVKNFSEEDISITKMQGLDPEKIKQMDAIRGYILREGGETLGFFCIIKVLSSFQTPLFLFEKYRGEGYGSKMIDLVEKTCIDLRIKAVYHRIAIENTRMLSLSFLKGYKKADQESAEYVTLRKEMTCH